MVQPYQGMYMGFCAVFLQDRCHLCLKILTVTHMVFTCTFRGTLSFHKGVALAGRDSKVPAQSFRFGRPSRPPRVRHPCFAEPYATLRWLNGYSITGACHTPQQIRPQTATPKGDCLKREPLVSALPADFPAGHVVKNPKGLFGIGLHVEFRYI